MGSRLSCVVLALWCFGVGLVYAQSENLEALLERGRELSKAAKYDQALPYVLLALERAERRYGNEDPALVPFIEALAELYATQALYRDAEPLYERALEIQERELARYQAGVAGTLNRLAAIYEATGRLARARAHSERVLALAQPGLGADHPSVRAARERLERLTEEAPPAPPKVAAPRPPPGVPGYRIHLTSIRDPADAAQEWARLKRLFGPLLAGLELSVTRVDLGPPRGVWHRIKAGPLDEAGARARCAAFAARGVWCRVVPPQPPAAPPAVAKPGEPPAPSPRAGYRIHLTSIRNPEDAEAEWRRLNRLYGDLLAGLDLAVVRADLGPERGVWHRIQGGPLSREAARALCRTFTAREVWCRVAPPAGKNADSAARQVVRRVRRRGVAAPQGPRRPLPRRPRPRWPRPRRPRPRCPRRPRRLVPWDRGARRNPFRI